jgi:hypothetical protein
MLKLNQVIAAVLATSAVGFAAAQEATPFDTNIVSTKSRAEVRTEADIARVAGLLQRGEATIFADDTSGSTLARAQVLAEAREAQRLGVLSRGEANVFATPAQNEQIRMAGLRAIGSPVASVR